MSSGTDAYVAPESDPAAGVDGRVAEPSAPGPIAGVAPQPAVDELSQLRHHLDGVLAHTDALIYAKDLQGRYTMANRAMIELVGRSEAELLGSTDWDLFPQDIAKQFTYHDLQVAGDGKVVRFEESVQQDDGSAKTFLTTKFPMLDASGVVYAVGGVSADITESVRTRRQLAASQQRWRALVDASPVAIAVLDAHEWRFLYANARAADVFGVGNAGELLGRAMGDTVPRGGRSVLRDRIAELFVGELLDTVRMEIVGFDERRRTIEVNAGLVTFDELVSIQVEIRDVTEREAAEAALRISEERFRMLWEYSPVGVVESDLHGIIVSANPALCALVGRDSQELIGQSGTRVLLSSDKEIKRTVSRAAAELRAGRCTQVTLETTYEHSSGRPIPVLVTVVLLTGSHGEPARYIATVMDVTARRKAEEDLRASEVLLRTAFDYAPTGMLLMDGEGRLLQANPAICSLLGRTEDELQAVLDDLSHVHPDDQVALFAAVEEAQASERGIASVDLRLVDEANRAHWVSVSIALLEGPNGVSYVLVQAQDIAERQAAHERLTHRATHDALTELPNRVLLSQRIKRALGERLERADNTDVAVLFLDLDGFKAINDAHGHQIGDDVLIEVARRLQHAVRPTDLVARLGGDEFVVLCDALPYAEEANRIADRLRDLISHPIQSARGQLEITASIGISHAVEGVTAEQMLGQSDAAMYAEKRHRGRRLPGWRSIPEQRPA